MRHRSLYHRINSAMMSYCRSTLSPEGSYQNTIDSTHLGITTQKSFKKTSRALDPHPYLAKGSDALSCPACRRAVDNNDKSLEGWNKVQLCWRRAWQARRLCSSESPRPIGGWRKMRSASKLESSPAFGKTAPFLFCFAPMRKIRVSSAGKDKFLYANQFVRDRIGLVTRAGETVLLS